MRVAPRTASQRRQKGSAADTQDSGLLTTGIKLVFTGAAALALLLNVAILALCPLWLSPREHTETTTTTAYATSTHQKTVLDVQPASVKLEPAILASGQQACRDESTGLLEPQTAMTWSDLENPLFKVDASSLRVLPPRGPAGDKVSQGRRWLTFGLSSIKRPKVSYLGITLSRLFNVMDLEEAPIALLVHLADFNEAWVQQTAEWLAEGFADQVLDGRLHAIHAPQSLYPLKQVPLSALSLKGFKNAAINARYLRHDTLQLSGHPTYWSEKGDLFIFWCQSKSAVAHRRWGIAAAADLSHANEGGCKAWVKGPSDHEVLDPRVVGWEEWTGNKWETVEGAGVSNLELQEGELLKFGDSPQRQWWRTKQNLDYTFLMWYASNISEYYMQLEDDIQPVPHFAAAVRSYIERSLMGEPWVMASFSSLGFIGKFFNATHLPKLAQFLLTFSSEAPCDWLVWDWIDALSPSPVAVDIPKDVEAEIHKKEAATREGPKALEKLGFQRDDLQLYYKAAGVPPIFRTEETPLDMTKVPIVHNGEKSPKYPLAELYSSMGPYKTYTEDQAYPPGDPVGFWSSDTCVEKDKNDCQLGGKYIQLVFRKPINLIKVEIRQGRPGHEKDYIRHGRLQAGFDRTCNFMQTMKELSQPDEIWEGHMSQEVECLQILLTKPQWEWVAIREIRLTTPDQPGPVVPLISSIEPALLPSEERVSREKVETPPAAHHALLHAMGAAIAGLIAGFMGWLAVWQSQKHFELGLQTVGAFTCWAVSFVLVLDVMLIFGLNPPAPPQMPDEVGILHEGIASRRLSSLPSPDTAELPRKPCKHGVPQRNVRIDSRALRPGVLDVDPSSVRHLGPSADPRSSGPSPTASGQQRFMSVGMVADPNLDVDRVAQAVTELVRLGSGQAVVAVLVAQNISASSRREQFVENLRKKFSAAEVAIKDNLHLLDPAASLYPPPPTRTGNVDIALLSMFLAPLAQNFMQVDPLCSMSQYYPSHIQGYTTRLDGKGIPWIVVQFSKQSHLRKLVRSRLVHRWAEMLVMFPDAPADSLFWQFIDVVGNETAPKAIFLGTDAAKHSRPDVKLQHHGREALIEHLGDVSSLQGKVQRAQESYFKKNVLLDTLFDNPPGNLTTNLQGRADMLQSLYDGSNPKSDVTCGGHQAKSCSGCPQGHGASWCNVECMWASGLCTAVFKTSQVMEQPRSGDSWIELVLRDAPLDIEIVNLRMGGQVLPPPKCKGKGHDCAKAELPDGDFDHALDDAELLFGRGTPGGLQQKDSPGCSEYVKMKDVSGREVFWRSPSSRPVRGVRCIKISMRRAQERPLVFRHLEVRTTKAKQTPSTTKALAPLPRSDQLHPASVPLRGLARPAGVRHQSQVSMSNTDAWREQHLEWVLIVSVAFVSGAFSGVMGCLFNTVRPMKRARRQRQV